MIERFRRTLRDGVRATVAGTAEPPRFTATDDDPGLFGPDSVTWIVHADAAMLIGGVRALLLQTLHPLTMAGVARHSAYKLDPLGRLHRTGRFLAATTYGSTADADAAIARVTKIHGAVNGTAPDGRHYDATDPHLLEWVHLTEVDSFLRAYQRYGRHTLAVDEADQYVAEMGEVAARLGVETPPQDVDGLRCRLADYRAEIRVDGTTRDAVRFILFPPLSAPTRLPYALIEQAAVGLLPRFVRRALWLPRPPGLDPLVVRPATIALIRTLGWALRAPSEAT